MLKSLIALKHFLLMGSFVLSGFVIAQVETMSLNDFFTQTHEFLWRNTENGRVKYGDIAKEPTQLNELMTFVAKHEVEGTTEAEIKAFYINSYNLCVIDQIVQNYPINSPMAVNGFFEQTEFNIAGNDWTLNHLENNVLRKKYPDPRYHFVLVCGAIGCPSIASFAYVPDQLESQLESQTKLALNNPAFVYEESGVVQLSEIFNWYKEDFGGSPKSALSYINGYRTSPFSSSKTAFYPYNWQLNELKTISGSSTSEAPTTPSNASDDFNLQTFTAGSLLAKGKWDITTFNTIYTQTKSNWLGSDFSGVRETFFTSLWQVTYGITKNKRINVGLDINFKSSARSSDSTASSVWRAFDFQNNDSTRVGVSSIGPRIKFSPFKRVSDFSVQSTFLIPTIEDPEGRIDAVSGNLYWSDWNRYTLWNQFFYTKTWGNFQLFAEGDLLFRIRRNKEQITHMDVPVTLIGSYFPTSKITLYGIVSHNTRYTYDITQDTPDWVIPMNYTSAGAGFKYQPKSNVTIELLYTNFVRGANTGLGSTFNIGVKYITK